MSMTADRPWSVPNWLILGTIGVIVIAMAVLVVFPGSLLVWQIGAWSLVVALLALLGLVLLSGYSLATRRTARTWPRMASFAAGLLILVIVAIGCCS